MNVRKVQEYQNVFVIVYQLLFAMSIFFFYFYLQNSTELYIYAC